MRCHLPRRRSSRGKRKETEKHALHKAADVENKPRHANRYWADIAGTHCVRSGSMNIGIYIDWHACGRLIVLIGCFVAVPIASSLSSSAVPLSNPCRRLPTDTACADTGPHAHTLNANQAATAGNQRLLTPSSVLGFHFTMRTRCRVHIHT